MKISDIGDGAAVGLLAPLAGLGVLVAHRRRPARGVGQEAVERIRQQGGVSRRVVNPHPAPRIHHLVSIADQYPASAIRNTLITWNVARAFDFRGNFGVTKPRRKQWKRIKMRAQTLLWFTFE